MPNARSPALRLRASGPLACFTRPELKVERVSYAVMTPSAARGLLEAVLWKPAIRWHVERIKVLAPIAFTSFRRNEVNSKAVTPPRAVVRDGGTAPHLFADEDRAQRNTVALRKVDYVVEAHFTLTERAGADDNVPKFVDMFARRVEKGQHYHQPHFGCREFAADVRPADGAPEPVGDTRDLGLMLWDVRYGADHGEKRNVALFFPARLERGVMEVPAEPPLASDYIAKGGAA